MRSDKAVIYGKVWYLRYYLLYLAVWDSIHTLLCTKTSDNIVQTLINAAAPF